MAERTVGRESCLHVVWSCGGLEVGQVTGHARGNSDGVIIVDVAARARNLGMKTSQRKTCCRVIEYRSQP